MSSEFESLFAATSITFLLIIFLKYQYVLKLTYTGRGSYIGMNYPIILSCILFTKFSYLVVYNTILPLEQTFPFNDSDNHS